jgi:SAM-dependent methyltransferase
VTTLDVGCGDRPRGAVNVDLHPEATPHRSPDQRKAAPPLNAGAIRNFVIADGCHLPFRTGAFRRARSHHTIEHAENPYLFLRELLRVSRGRVEVVCPHRLEDTREKVLHISKLNLRWFEEAARRLGAEILKLQISDWRLIPSPYMPVIRLPREIRATLRPGGRMR